MDVTSVWPLPGTVRVRLDKDIFEGGHRFSGRKAFDWHARWL